MVGAAGTLLAMRMKWLELCVWLYSAEESALDLVSGICLLLHLSSSVEEEGRGEGLLSICCARFGHSQYARAECAQENSLVHRLPTFSYSFEGYPSVISKFQTVEGPANREP